MRSIKFIGDRAGFSLLEVMIALSLSTMLFAAIFSSFIFMGRSSLGIANYSEMNNESRMGLEIFGRDIRSAEEVHEGFSETEFTVVVPDDDGGSSEAVTYTYLPDHPDRPLVRTDSAGERIIMTGIQKLKFSYYNLQAGEAFVQVEVKQIQLQLTLVRKAIGLDNTEKVVSARYILRNKKVHN